MSTYISSLNHIIFSTKARAPILKASFRPELYKCIGSTCSNLKCHPIAINGTEDHIHLLLSMHPSIAISDLVKSIKIISSAIIKEKNWFPYFDGWQIGYGHFTYTMNQKNVLEKYIQEQEKHHLKFDSKEELRKILAKHEIQYDPKYFH